MAENKTVQSGGIGVIGLLGLLGVLFVALKLISVSPVAHWSWRWVTAPFWGGFVLVALIVSVVILFAVLSAVFASGRNS